MGKKAKKIKKNIMNIQAGEKGQSANSVQRQQVREIKEKVARLKADEQYEEALQEIIKLFEMDYADQGIVYETAEIYYLVGDYERAITWADKTLAFDENHVAAQILLAKLYALQDELNNCFKTLEKLLSGNQQISAELKVEIEDLLDYFAADYSEEELKSNYPHIWDFSRCTENDVIETNTVEINVAEAAEESSCYIDEVDEDNHGDMESVEMLHTSVACEAAEDEFACLKGKPTNEVIAAIMNQSISLTEKIDTCLYFAVYYYSQKDIAGTLMLLKQAVLIDGHNDLVLKNVGFVLAEMGEKQGALEFLLKVKEKDLMVLHQIELLS